VKHWADGGETSLDNCLLLCRHHHRLVHEEGWRVDWWGPGRPAFRSPRGWIEYEGGWEGPGGNEGRDSGKDVSAETSGTAEWGDGDPSATALVQANEALGITPDAWTASARWKREMDIPTEVLWRAEEAILR
jgi:hypothetical protein